MVQFRHGGIYFYSLRMLVCGTLFINFNPKCMNEKERKKQVYLRRGLQEELVKQFNCSHSTVSMALSFKLNSQMARKIRSYAINNLRGYFI